MGDRLSILRRSYETNPGAFRRVHKSPVLIWEQAPPPSKKMDRELLWNTQGNYKLSAAGDDPLVYTVTKSTKTNAFGIGITLGRTANNDIEIDDPSVSRFHAFFQLDEQSGIWHVVDAESSNGTWLEGERLTPKRPAPLPDRASLTCGSVALRFMLPVSFDVHLVRLGRK